MFKVQTPATGKVKTIWCFRQKVNNNLISCFSSFKNSRILNQTEVKPSQTLPSSPAFPLNLCQHKARMGESMVRYSAKDCKSTLFVTFTIYLIPVPSDDKVPLRMRAVSLFSQSVEENALDLKKTTRVTEGARRKRCEKRELSFFLFGCRSCFSHSRACLLL